MAKVTKNRSHRKREIEDHIVDETVIAEEGVGDWHATKGEVHSTTVIEDDDGHGKAVVIRSFDFKANPETFRMGTPSSQELFNAHARQIEVFLMNDGLKVMPEVNPQVKLSKNRQYYRIVVGAEPMRGFLVDERPKTLKQITNDASKST